MLINTGNIQTFFTVFFFCFFLMSYEFDKNIDFSRLHFLISFNFLSKYELPNLRVFLHLSCIYL